MDAVRSRAEAEKCLHKMAELSLGLALAIGTRDAAVERAQREHAKVIEGLTARLIDAEARVRNWADHNRKAFGDAQSLEFPSGTIRYRKGPRALDLLAGADWKTVLKKMTAQAKTWAEFIRIKREPDRQKLLAAARSDAKATPALTAAKLRSIGLRVAEEESFHIELRTGPNQIQVL